MRLSTLRLRLKQLGDNIDRVLKLLNDYEVELLYESDPTLKKKYQLRIEKLREQQDNYEKEFEFLQEQLGNEQLEEQISVLVNQLQQIDNKLNWLSSSKIALYQAILEYFTIEEKSIIAPIARHLEEAQIIEVKSLLEETETSYVSESEIRLIIPELQQALLLLEEKGIELPDGNKEIVKILNYPTLDAKHALKVSIPIIPFILSYEGELGLGVGIKIRELWDSLKNKLWQK